MRTIRLLLTAATLLPLFTHAAELASGNSTLTSETSIFEPPRQIAPIPAWLPGDFYETSETARTVVLQTHIDATGSVVDAVAIRAGDMRLVRLAENLLRKARFEPARESGQPVAVLLPCVIRFTEPTDVQSVSVLQFTAQHAQFGFNPELALQQAQRSELDHPLEFAVAPEPVLPIQDDGTPITGTATIEGFVDHNGNLRLMHIAEASHPRVASAALQAFADCRFTPPTKNGKPVVTRVRLPYSSHG